MKRIIGISVALIMAGTFALAQQFGGSDSSRTTGGNNHMGRGAMTQEEFQKLGDYAEQARRLTKDDKEQGKTLEDLLAEDKAAATALVAAMPLSCEVADAILAATGPAKIDGKEVETKTYEVACTNGMGYFLVQPEGAKPYGFSCLAAEATREADVAAGRKPGTVCKLGANKDPKAIVSKVLSHSGVNCTTQKIYWHGTNAKVKIEYNEAACADGKGYILLSALPGSTMPPQSMDCKAAGMRGLPCKLTDTGPIVTKQTFIDALKTHNVACSADVNKVHVIGQESGQKRYVVEFVCPEKPDGLVAFIPLQGSKAKFEAISCKDAAKRKAMCTLNK